MNWTWLPPGGGCYKQLCNWCIPRALSHVVHAAVLLPCVVYVSVCSSEEQEHPRVRGVTYRWQGYSSSVHPEPLLFSRPVRQAALGTSHGVLLTEGTQSSFVLFTAWHHTFFLKHYDVTHSTHTILRFKKTFKRKQKHQHSGIIV